MTWWILFKFFFNYVIFKLPEFPLYICQQFVILLFDFIIILNLLPIICTSYLCFHNHFIFKISIISAFSVWKIGMTQSSVYIWKNGRRNVTMIVKLLTGLLQILKYVVDKMINRKKYIILFSLNYIFKL